MENSVWIVKQIIENIKIDNAEYLKFILNLLSYETVI